MAIDPGSSPPPNRPLAPRRRRRWIWVVAALLVIVLAIWLSRTLPTHAQATAGKAGGKGGRGAAAGMVVPVAAAQAHRGDVPVYLDGIGNVSAFYTVTVHTRVDGQLMTVAFQEGQFVHEGDLLVQVDPRPYQVQLEQAEGQMAHDQALLADARIDLARYRTLLAQDAIPKQQLDTQVYTVQQDEGQIKTDQANIDNAKLQLVYCRITAPISGRVGLRLVDPGNMVHASDATGIVVITQVQPIAALFTIPEDSLPSVLHKLHQGSTLPVDAFNRDKSQKLDSGKLLTVDNQIDPTTGTSRLKAVFQNHQFGLFPNQFVNLRLLVNTLPNQVLVPTAAIQRGSQGTFVWVVKPSGAADGSAHGSAHRSANAPAQGSPAGSAPGSAPGPPAGPPAESVENRIVTTGITEGDNTSITSGLNAGENVVIDGADKLQPGSKVRVVPEAAHPQGGATAASGSEGGPAA